MRSCETEKDSIARNDDSKGSKPKGAVIRRGRRMRDHHQLRIELREP
jgi:hypothetical protein